MNIQQSDLTKAGTIVLYGVLMWVTTWPQAVALFITALYLGWSQKIEADERRVVKAKVDDLEAMRGEMKQLRSLVGLKNMNG